MSKRKEESPQLSRKPLALPDRPVELFSCNLPLSVNLTENDIFGMLITAFSELSLGDFLDQLYECLITVYKFTEIEEFNKQLQLIDQEIVKMNETKKPMQLIVLDPMAQLVANFLAQQKEKFFPLQ